MARAFIGTSGWNYKHWVGPFYPPGLAATRHLQYYTQFFDTVELNTTFYHLPRPTTPANWAAKVPDGFVYAVKASRFITHVKKLLDPAESLSRFFESIEGLGDRTGPILVQLPPRFNVDTARLVTFLKALPAGFRYTFEFRDQSWLTDEVYGLLRHHNAAVCIFQLAGFETAHVVTADFVYIRLHGPKRSKYTGSYSTPQLEAWAAEIKGWLSEDRDVYCYFDNDQAAYAVQNALELKQLLNGDAPTVVAESLFG